MRKKALETVNLTKFEINREAEGNIYIYIYILRTISYSYDVVLSLAQCSHHVCIFIFHLFVFIPVSLYVFLHCRRGQYCLDRFRYRFGFHWFCCSRRLDGLRFRCCCSGRLSCRVVGCHCLKLLLILRLATLRQLGQDSSFEYRVTKLRVRELLRTENFPRVLAMGLDRGTFRLAQQYVNVYSSFEF